MALAMVMRMGIMDEYLSGATARKRRDAAMQPQNPLMAATGMGGEASGNPMAQYGDVGSLRDAFAAVESDGSGGYSAVGPDTGGGSRAYGRYQVMDFNIGPWTREILGREMTPEEFLADPAAQDAVFDAKIGGYMQQYGTVQDAASMWFSGRPMSEAGNASDGYLTVPQYVGRIMSAYGG